MGPDLTLLIATHRRPASLTRTLTSLAHLETTGLTWELVLVDNADDAATRDVVERMRDRLPVHYVVERTAGKNHAMATGVREARGPLVVFTDDDILADSRWLAEIAAGARRWPDRLVFGGRILPAWPAAPPTLDHPFLAPAYGIADWQRAEGEISPYRVWGGNMAIRRRVFLDGWGFDSTFGPRGRNYLMGGETDLVVRLADAGHAPIHLPRAVVSHIIRPEQLTTRWLCGRAFLAGRAITHFHEPDRAGVPRLLGVPRYLIRSVAVQAGRYGSALLAGDRTRRLDAVISFHQTLGRLYQHVVTARRR